MSVKFTTQYLAFVIILIYANRFKGKRKQRRQKIGLFSPFSGVGDKNQIGSQKLYSQQDLLKLKEQISDLKNLNESIANQLENLEHQAQMIQESTRTTFFLH
ncbi:hypothetical protein AUK11_03710 [bacterium CG2_30_37_16]|nr:MAG: hypothetical protein AUK11_03710 [bacterium CG2_30_37_16]PIP31127.1 MAG: hypothetical protein COX25_01020 [bacterium (Candidatus Howlettbacteria) CG23_combo_of_CG06-09_8_20_14_all_37_9]PIY00244.1 MAG: hypothetical protein COZ22_00700 [bacterium (Candidatus Howlettbacteria) CG_4_10_14_3_um_filter_37_10]PJB06058.1 MAG: hypothetical protein CO123_02860 [bacterium (Candidatus Howlettbacteria) CG_4_9_14_3_um_filter_37_10]